MAEKKQSRIIAQNKKAYHDFFVEETYEAGIELSGTEVKSLRRGNANLKDSFCRIEDGEIFAYGIHISPYEQGNIFNKDPPGEKAPHAPQRDKQAVRACQPERLHARAALAVFLELEGEGAARALHRQKALRQARKRRKALRRTGYRPRDEGRPRRMIYGDVKVSTGTLKQGKRAEPGQSL